MIAARPIYRWKSFWLGVVVLVFLCWAWQQAMRRDQGVTVGTPVIAFGVYQFEGQAGVFAVKLKQSWDISRSSGPRKTKAVWFPHLGRVGLSEVDGSARGRWYFHARFAHWFLMLAAVVVWSAWLACKWKRARSIP